MKMIMIDKKIILGYLILVFIFFPVSSISKTLMVPDNYTSVASAVEAAQKGDTVLIEDRESIEENIRQINIGSKGLTISFGERDAGDEPTCQTHNFEGFDEDEIITSQIPGVSFSVAGQSCKDFPILYMRARQSWYGDDFGNKALVIDTGCPDFSPDYLRMIFDDRQKEVSFRLGPWDGPYQIRAYTTVSGGDPIISRIVTIPGSGFVGTPAFVNITRGTRDIRRIEVEAMASGHEAIDDLTFGIDHTPPTVEIQIPDPLTCLSGEIAITGITCDDDGAYDRDRLEYKRIYPDADTDWILAREYVGSPVCSAAPLYDWDTTLPEIIDGVYLLRITAVNKCGLTVSDEITVYVDNEFSTVDFQGPTGIVGGKVCFTGTVWDLFCFSQYTVQYRAGSSGTRNPVDPAHPFYDTSITNDPIASWVGSHLLPDGLYEISVTGETNSGKTKNSIKTLILDNTAPIANINFPDSCTDPGGVVAFIGTAYDKNLYRWSLDHFNTDTDSWVSISHGTSSVIKGNLGTLTRDPENTCSDVIRLRVWDKALVDPCSTWGNDRHLSETYVILTGSPICRGDYDGDGDVDSSDLAAFADEFGGSCP